MPSHESPGVQLADIASYAVWRHVEMLGDSMALVCKDMFDREPLTGAINPGKWHGIKYIGNDHVVMSRIYSVWTQ